ncbi:hypothetical protein ES708_31197 [subsurface metagenome]
MSFVTGWYPEGNRWVRLRVDEDGSIHVVGYVDKLEDIGDVLLTAIANNDILYWDATAGRWKNIAHLGLPNAHHAQAHTLASHSTKAHAELTNVTEAQHHAKFTTVEHLAIGNGAPHHTKYTNNEAKAAAVQAGAITDGVTKAPTHDAVYDVKLAADASKILTITFIIDGGGAVITTGVKGALEIPFACTINRWTLLGDQSGSIQVNIWKQAYDDYPPEAGQKITGDLPPKIEGAFMGQSATLTGWTVAITAGDCLMFNVDSITSCERVTLSLKVTKT